MFDYIPLTSLKERRERLSERIERQESHEYQEAVEIVRAFIDDTGLTKEDIYPTAKKSRFFRPSRRTAESSVPLQKIVQTDNRPSHVRSFRCPAALTLLNKLVSGILHDQTSRPQPQQGAGGAMDN